MMEVVDWPGVRGTITTEPPQDSTSRRPTTVSGA